MRELRDLQRGRVLIGSNEGGVHMLLPLIERFREKHPKILVDVRRVPARQVGVEVAQGSLDFGIVTFDPGDKRLNALALGADELVLLVYPGASVCRARQRADRRSSRTRPSSRTAIRRRRAIRCCGRPSCVTRRSIFRLRCRASKASSGRWSRRWAWRCCRGDARWRKSRAGQLVAVKIPEVRLPRQVRLVYRKGELSHAAAAFLAAAEGRTLRLKTQGSEGSGNA